MLSCNALTTSPLPMIPMRNYYSWETNHQKFHMHVLSVLFLEGSLASFFSMDETV